MASDDHIENVRPLIGINSPLKVFPPFWLQNIEHKIQRGSSSCWYWVGMLDGCAEPALKIKDPETGKYKVQQLKRIVARMFWDLKPHWEVLHACGNQNCLNPRHFYITSVNYQQHNRTAILTHRRAIIRRWDTERKKK